MRKILITGYDGQLGFDIKRVLEEQYGNSVDILATTYVDLDITNKNDVGKIVSSFKPDVIFHCAAYTNVDKAESDEATCNLVNVEGTRNLLKVASSIGAKFVFISTDYVFDGSLGFPYDESSYRNPLSVYGNSKKLAENIVKEYPKSFIVRISWLFGINGKNFVKTMLNLAKDHDKLRVVDDQIGSPTYSLDLARTLVEIAKTEKYGVYHVNNTGYTSWYNFAKKIFELKGIPMEIEPVKSDEYAQIAKRPLDSRLNRTNLIANGFDLLPTWEDALKRYFVELSYEENKENGIITFANGSKAISTDVKDAYIIEPRVFGDERGYFSPFFVSEYMEALGFSKTAQLNRSKSDKYVLRGLHFQDYPHDQAKLVEVINGKAIDVIIDLRVGSPTYGKSVSLLLMPYDKNILGSGRQLFVPRGFAHGFISLEDNTVFQYVIDNTYAPKFENGIPWNDKIISDTWERIFEKYNIDPNDLILSEKDKERLPLEECKSQFTYHKRVLKP